MTEHVINRAACNKNAILFRNGAKIIVAVPTNAPSPLTLLREELAAWLSQPTHQNLVPLIHHRFPSILHVTITQTTILPTCCAVFPKILTS